MKTSVNTLCPCGSKKKYKLCCQRYHKGAQAKDALALMKSRYSAYVKGEVKYIIKTTHPNNPLYEKDIINWSSSIENFTKETEFKGLEIISFNEGNDEATVEFIVKTKTESWREKSTFIKEHQIWFYRNYAIILE